jgi:hypothetical protein
VGAQVLNEVLNDKTVNTYGVPIIQSLMERYTAEWSSRGEDGVRMGWESRNFTFNVSGAFLIFR